MLGKVKNNNGFINTKYIAGLVDMTIVFNLDIFLSGMS